MKTLFVGLFVALILANSGESSVASEGKDSPKAMVLNDPVTLEKILAEALEGNTFRKKGKEGEELYYASNEQTPYTGWAKKMHDNGLLKELIQLKDGKLDGLSMLWYKNERKERQVNWKVGKREGLRTEWHRNGQKRTQEKYKDGKLDGLATIWYDNGQKKGEGRNVAGKLASAMAWKPNGEKCPFTNVKDGNGVVVLYDDDGREKERFTFKEGEIVKD